MSAPPGRRAARRTLQEDDMQETPVVTLPQDQRRHNGYLLLAILILVALVLVAAVLVARPDLLIR